MMQTFKSTNVLRSSLTARPVSRVQRVSVVTQSAAGNWFPGSETPAHLSSSSLPGNFGFDPLNLGKDPEKLKWYAQAELQHARWAMLGVAGVLGAEATGHDWFTAGSQEYFADSKTLFAIQMFLMAWVEIRRLQDMRKPGSANQDPIFSNNKLPDGNEPGYPGGIFDPAGFAKGDVNTLKLKEIKNGRLAMVAFLGFIAQHSATGKGPLTNLADHLADPWSNLVITNGVSVPFATHDGVTSFW
ncbi:Chlorophyll a-b binding protein P4 [Picochlorum sp. SENEW3]|nr:Chlorophyll a-b binding protein P4 [Picochlorum sp. SENEW3]